MAIAIDRRQALRLSSFLTCALEEKFGNPMESFLPGDAVPIVDP